jgi:predicted NBD/HSP70 family sugar kinase
METPKGDHQLLRRHNRGIVLNLLREGEPLSRTELAQLTGLAPSVLTRLVRDLLAEGVVREVGKGRSQGGRRPTLLSLDPGYAYAIGIKVERGRLLGARVDLAGDIRARASLPFDPAAGPEALYQGAARLADELSAGRILGLGIGISGFVDAGRSVDLFSPILGWRDVPLADPLSRALGIPVYVENDVNSLTLAERRYGAGRDFSDFICITVGEGIGSGIVLRGELYRGAFGGAGELGHMTIDPEGPRCRCGARGCLETLASDQFLRQRARELGFPGIGELATAAREGDEEARSVYRDMGRALGIGAKNLVNLLNPQAILLGGERMVDADLFLPAFEEEVRRHSFPKEAESLYIGRAQLGEDGFLLGTAALVLEEFFRLPTQKGAVEWK